MLNFPVLMQKFTENQEMLDTLQQNSNVEIINDVWNKYQKETRW